ncbi:hypothetical protein [Listeria booriae]|uniref:hypothetical protein n=1 Tax=Listeria booriae TaxID=1552123 RepID=UPI0016279A93|nr:hypothetical protein [Listeria booriae]
MKRMIWITGTAGMKKRPMREENPAKEVVMRFHVLGYFLVTFLFIGMGIMFGFSEPANNLVMMLVSFSKYVLLLLIVGIIGIWRAKEMTSRLFFAWFIILFVAYMGFLISVILTRTS